MISATVLNMASMEFQGIGNSRDESSSNLPLVRRALPCGKDCVQPGVSHLRRLPEAKEAVIVHL